MEGGKKAYMNLALGSKNLDEYANRLEGWKNEYGWGIGERVKNAYHTAAAAVSDSLVVKPYAKHILNHHNNTRARK
jgi:hypothetical protein